MIKGKTEITLTRKGSIITQTTFANDAFAKVSETDLNNTTLH